MSFYQDFADLKLLLGASNSGVLDVCTDEGYHIKLNITCSKALNVNICVDSSCVVNRAFDRSNASIHKVLRLSERVLSAYGYDLFSDICKRSSIFAAINTKNLASDLVRVKSSNVWAYGLNIKDRKSPVGDLVVQFKSKDGGAGDVYIYYDVPTMVYRRWQSAPSKGHYFWTYIRGKYSYSKLTGDKRGKMKGAIN